MSTQLPTGKRQLWIWPVLQVVLVIALVVTTAGASGIFAMGMCPLCPGPEFMLPERPTMPEPEIKLEPPVEKSDPKDAK